MLKHFFEQQLDYIFFFYGLTFILLGVLGFILHRRLQHQLPWFWLGLFGITHGLSEWLNMLAFSYGDNIIFYSIRTLVIVTDYIFLFEFGRAGLVQMGVKHLPGRWIYIPPVLIILIAWILAGPPGANAIARYTLGLGGGLLSAYLLFRFAKSDHISRYSLMLSSGIFFVYALITGIFPPPAGFFPASVINTDTFFAVTGIPLYLLKGALAVMITAPLWNYYYLSREHTLWELDIKFKRNDGILFSFVIFVIIACGWLLTQYMGYTAESEKQNEALEKAVLISNSITYSTGATQADLHKELSKLQRNTPGTERIYLIAQKEDSFYIVASSMNEQEDKYIKPGMNYDNIYPELASVFRTNRPESSDYYTEILGNYFSSFAPVSDDDNQVIAVLQTDTSTDKWLPAIAQRRSAAIYITLLLSTLFVGFFLIRQNLIESHQRIAMTKRNLMDAQKVVHIGSWTYETGSGEITWSEEMFRVLGYDRKLPVPAYADHIQFFMREDWDKFDEALQDAIKSGQGFSMELRMVSAGGQTKYIFTRANVKQGENGKFTKVTAIFQDITEKKHAEEVINAWQNRYELVIAASGQIVYEEDLNTGEIIWGGSIDRVIGYSMSDMQGGSAQWRSMMYPDDRVNTLIILEKARKSLMPYSVEYRIRHRNLNYIWIHDRGYFSASKNKQNIRIIGMMQDITARKEAELALMANLQFRQTLIDSIPYPIFYKNKAGVYLGCNTAFENFLKLPREKIITRTVYDVMPKESADMHSYADRELIKSPGMQKYETGGTDGDGIEHEFVFIKATFNDTDGKTPAGIIGAMIDITEKNKYEHQLRELNATKDKFFSIIAHDLKNPFNALMGFSETLYENAGDMEPDEIKQLAERLYHNSKSAYSLLENLLQWSRSQTGRLDYHPERVELNHLVEESIRIVAGQAFNKNIHITNKTDGIFVRADSNLIKTVFRNLLSNAIKYTNDGGDVIVSATADNDTVTISVSDTGVGMSREAMGKIFHIESKYSTKGTAKESGTGLGLILCKEFVERHGGRIWVESPYQGDSHGGKGSVFRFTLPVADE